MNSNDLRVIKTKRALYDSLILLMSDNNFENIKVSDICNKALVNRSTFYFHYKDKYELLSSLISNLKDDLSKDLDKNDNIDSAKKYYMEMIKIFLSHIDDNKNIYSTIIKNNSDSIVLNMVIDTMTRDIENKISNRFKSSIPIEFITKFYLGAVIYVGIEYIKSPNKWSKEKVINYLDILLPDNIY